MPLSDAAVRGAKPAATPRKLSDGGGLFLLIQPKPIGSKLWRLAYRFGGKQKTLALGIYPTVSLSQARDGRDEAKKLLASGVDPSVQRKTERQLEKTAAENSFRTVAEEVIAKLEREGRAHVTISKKRWLLDFAYPAFGDRPVSEITAKELLALLREIEGRGIYETAKRLRSTCGMVFRYAIATGRAERDPSADLRGALTTHRVIHRATIVEPTGHRGAPTRHRRVRRTADHAGRAAPRPACVCASGRTATRRVERIRPQCRRLDYTGIKNENAPPASGTAVAAIAQHNPRVARDHWQRAVGVPFSSHRVATDLGEYPQCSAAPARLRLGRHEHPWFPLNGFHSAERDGQVEPRRHRATTRSPGGKCGAARVHPWGGVLV